MESAFSRSPNKIFLSDRLYSFMPSSIIQSSTSDHIVFKTAQVRIICSLCIIAGNCKHAAFRQSVLEGLSNNERGVHLFGYISGIVGLIRK